MNLLVYKTLITGKLLKLLFDPIIFYVVIDCKNNFIFFHHN